MIFTIGMQGKIIFSIRMHWKFFFSIKNTMNNGMKENVNGQESMQV